MSLSTGNNAIDSLVASSWNYSPATPVSLTYGFLTRVPLGAAADDRAGFAPMSAAQQAAVRDALAQWAAVANITFVEVAANAGKLQFATNVQEDSAAYAYLPMAGGSAVQMYLNNEMDFNTVFTAGSYGPTVLMHEIGHMLGLKHPGDYDSLGSGIDGPFLPAATDNGDYTLMSYNDPSSYAVNRTFNVTPMLYDIQAIQYLYGANMSYHTGNDTYAVAAGTPPMCIWDAGGSDTLDFSACLDATVVNLNAGAFSETSVGLNNISIAYNVTIESAIGGAGGTTFYANGAGNRLTGGAGNDVFHQGAGNDTIAGAGGQDTVVFVHDYASYSVVRDGDTLTVQGEGTDILTGVESLRFADRTLSVNAFAQTVAQVGTAANDLIQAPAGNARIDGGAGLDVVAFAGARDSYQLARTAEGYTLTGGGVTDTLVNVERLHFADGDVALDVDGAAGQLYRLYAAAFDRAPDAGGFGFWLHGLDGGVPLATVAEAFAASPEFVQTYGPLDDAGYLTQLYANLLDRPYDQGGFDFWLGVLERGVPRGEVLAGFSESAEFQAKLVGSLENGVDFIAYG